MHFWEKVKCWFNKNKKYILIGGAVALVLVGAGVGYVLCKDKKISFSDWLKTAPKEELEEAYEKFGFFIDAFTYGAPPHAGLAYGLDRLVMLLLGEDNLREVIAFPKVKDASCPMSSAPSVVDEQQLKDLSLKIDLPEKE